MLGKSGLQKPSENDQKYANKSKTATSTVKNDEDEECGLEFTDQVFSLKALFQPRKILEKDRTNVDTANLQTVADPRIEPRKKLD